MHDNNPKDNEKGYGNENNPNRQMPKIYRPQLIGGQVPNRLQAVNLGNLPPVPMLGKIPNIDNLHGQNINLLPQVMPRNIVNPPKRQIFLGDIQLPGFEELFGQENQQIEPVRQAQPGQQVIQPTNGNFRYANNINDPQILKDWDDYLDSIQLAKRTRCDYKRYVGWFFHYMDMNKISNPSADDVLNYIRYEKVVNGVKKGLARNIISTIRQFFIWACKRAIYPNIMIRMPRGVLNKIYREDNQLHQESSDLNSENDEFRVLENLIGSVSQQLPPIRRNRRLQQPQNVFGGLQQAQANIELQQKKDRLNKMLSELKGLNRIDDPMIKEAWELYIDIYIAEKNLTNKYSIKSNVNRFIEYLRERSISTPSIKDILNFIENRKMVDDISFGAAESLLSYIRTFFRFVSKFSIYDDVSLGLKRMHIQTIYGLATSPVMKKRQDLEQMMQNNYPGHKLDPSCITRYINDINGNFDCFKQLLSFKEYLEKNHILQLTTNDITTFFLINKDMFNNYDSIISFWGGLKQFFAWTSKETSLDGQILYPDIGQFLDGPNLIDALLMWLDPNNHSKNKRQESVIPEYIRDLMECLGLETESGSEE